ncbi:CDP-alcohol phosphatidyltransferase family protein [Thermosulfurimonas sp. F29]|uniref:CDP-alcohol phosphatidyltransferase family protein n=1 Tax=Thermosulfurimonas sp. F29 TaxID=2867247 RepID=UPI001C83928A|nr:CDP-alcohol phosphatidyltransferase family protein [Thermosulfurimonas sp. F29]MBX6422470.1 CDP-alcohol phosphatidyltransferase family protein [Thermosulfurimonas sp. F29]
MLRLTPNRLTLLRIVLLPLPCFLLFGGPESKLTALGLGSLLGLTDYLDGRMARRIGSSRLGALLDPVADKIFVGVTYLLLYRLGYLPYVLVFPLLLREILVSGLRGIQPEGLRVRRLARFKTALQMGGAGMIILAGFLPVFPGRLIMEMVAGGVLILTWISAWPYLRRGVPALGSFPGGWGNFSLTVIPPVVLLGLFPMSGTFWPLVLVLLGGSFLSGLLLSFRRPAKVLNG